MVGACLNSIRPCGTGRNGTELFFAFRFWVEESCIWVLPEILGLSSLISANDNFLRMPQHNNSMLVRSKCPPPSTVMPISIKQDFIFTRSGGPFCPPEEEIGVQHMFFLFLENCFRGPHGICSMSATNQYQHIWQILFHSVRSNALLGG